MALLLHRHDHDHHCHYHLAVSLPATLNSFRTADKCSSASVNVGVTHSGMKVIQAGLTISIVSLSLSILTNCPTIRIARCLTDALFSDATLLDACVSTFFEFIFMTWVAQTRMSVI